MKRQERLRIEISDKMREEKQIHQSVTLLFALEGKLDVSVENKISHMKEEDILIINAGKHYSYQAATSVLFMILHIDYQMLSEKMHSSEVVFWCDSSIDKNTRYDELRALIRTMLNHYVEVKDYSESFCCLSDGYAIINQLVANYMIQNINPGSPDGGVKYDDRIQRINDYINMNYDQDISMKELSEKLYLSNGYLSRFFKKNYGLSFANYLSNVRVFHAADDLIYTDSPITRIAYNNGFTSAALFNKIFKKNYGVTPSEYRYSKQPDKKDDNKTKQQEKVEKRLQEIVETQEFPPEKNTASVRTFESTFTAGQEVPVKPCWSEVINFGDAEKLLHSGMREHLMILKKALQFRYVRFWGLFSTDLFIDPQRSGDYNFDQIDNIIDYILEQDMIPYIELGQKPRTIHYEIGRTESDASNYMPEEFSLEQWKHLLRAFMRHLSARYEQSAMDSWIMEYWFNESWRLDEGKSPLYLDYFDATYSIIKEYNSNIKVGGYGIRMDTGDERRKQFLKIWNTRPCRPDFISIMFYAYERREDGQDRYARRSADNDIMQHLFYKEQKLISEAGLGDIPIHLNEWNLTPSVRNFINDTTFKGAYIVKNIIDMYDSFDVMGYGLGSDRAHAAYDTPDLLYGGNGLLTKDGIMKPAAFAFDFFNRLYPYYIGKSKYVMATTDNHDNYAFVCHNQQVLNYNYYMCKETEIEKENDWKYYEGRKKLNLSICVENVSDGRYIIKLYRINDNDGSVLGIWGELNYEKEPSRNDIKYFRRMCEPSMNIRTIEVKNGHLLIEEQMLPNEIMFIRARKER